MLETKIKNEYASMETGKLEKLSMDLMKGNVKVSSEEYLQIATIRFELAKRKYENDLENGKETAELEFEIAECLYKECCYRWGVATIEAANTNTQCDDAAFEVVFNVEDRLIMAGLEVNLFAEKEIDGEESLVMVSAPAQVIKAKMLEMITRQNEIANHMKNPKMNPLTTSAHKRLK